MAVEGGIGGFFFRSLTVTYEEFWAGWQSEGPEEVLAGR